jgi:hypothetical protein
VTHADVHHAQFPPAVLGVILLLGGLELAGAKGSHFEGWSAKA